MTQPAVVDVKGLRVDMDSRLGRVDVLRGVDLKIDRGEVVGLVGETGSGKTMAALSIMRLLPTPPMHLAGGQIVFDGEDIVHKTEQEMGELRGDRIAMIFQDPVSYLNPVFTIGEQLIDVVATHSDREDDSRQGSNRTQTATARERAIELLSLVGLPEAEERMNDYPHQFSGGMAQRIMIAMAISGNPEVLIADEPTSALDVTVQVQILRLIRDLALSQGLSVLFITHNLAAMTQICTRVNVMYLGQVVESCSVDTLVSNPLHPYTRGLMRAVPVISADNPRISGITGAIPSLFDVPEGCSFAPRCSDAKEICHIKTPHLVEVEPGHLVSCHG